MERAPYSVPDTGTTQGGYRPLIFLAEDDEDLRRLLRMILEGDGYRVADVASGTALLAELRRVNGGEEPPALIISDERMPGIRGIRILEQARNWGWTLPLLLITAFGDRALMTRARGVDVRVLRKPFDMDDFRTVVQWFVPRRMAPLVVCAACGRSDLLASPEDMEEVRLCAECRQLGKDIDPGDPGDPLVSPGERD